LKDDNDYRLWYKHNQQKYKSLAKEVEKLLKYAIRNEDMRIHHTQSRLKSYSSFEEKMYNRDENKNFVYSKPTQITDVAGIRVVVFVLSEMELISQLIEKNFEIDWQNSVDKFKELGEDKFGYRSRNYVASIKEETITANLKRYAKFKGLYFEIQVKTILDHAWSEIEHDRNYKRTNDFPQETGLRRRFKLLAGVLEIVDNEFQKLATEISQYENTTSIKLRKKEMDIRIHAYTLREYLTKRFSDIPGFIPLFFVIEEDLDELNSMGIRTIGEFDKIIPKNFKRKCKSVSRPSDHVTFSIIIREVLMIHFKNKYLEDAWKRHYNTLDYHIYKVLEKFGVKLTLPSGLEFD